MLETLLDILYPRRCPVCSEIVDKRGELSCTGCRNRLITVEEPKCKKCGKPLEQETKEYCYDCDRRRHYFERGFSLWLYNEDMQKSMADFKYKGRREYAAFYINELLKKYQKEIEDISPDALVPVPIHKKKRQTRGYNQAEILADELGKRLNLPVLSELLIRKKDTLPQKQLNDKERFRNISEAFAFSQEERCNYKKELQRVLLVDDIYTTGSTIEACARALKMNGIEEVYFVSICIGKGY
ncbi:ComF family protein [Anaerocolumna xylanovorans]|uniref:ComF family protein n=1 Tax=Anaerocolumna xylanovorans DSM 12503 TaxID=1121345 RepID=A0A1M7YA10_9FIRM|nr:ComF family protein [Anaerocolumna xylanovorans]SHO49475.1 comF family protein [Anaerocolumna xylanovorans DSM 12503]